MSPWTLGSSPLQCARLFACHTGRRTTYSCSYRTAHRQQCEPIAKHLHARRKALLRASKREVPFALATPNNPTKTGVGQDCTHEINQYLDHRQQLAKQRTFLCVRRWSPAYNRSSGKECRVAGASTLFTRRAMIASLMIFAPGISRWLDGLGAICHYDGINSSSLGTELTNLVGWGGHRERAK